MELTSHVALLFDCPSALYATKNSTDQCDWVSIIALYATKNSTDQCDWVSIFSY